MAKSIPRCFCVVLSSSHGCCCLVDLGLCCFQGLLDGGRANPCVVRANPCVVRANPCVVRANPCVVRANPCVVRANPCVVRANPCVVRVLSRLSTPGWHWPALGWESVWVWGWVGGLVRVCRRCGLMYAVVLLRCGSPAGYSKYSLSFSLPDSTRWNKSTRLKLV